MKTPVLPQNNSKWKYRKDNMRITKSNFRTGNIKGWRWGGKKI